MTIRLLATYRGFKPNTIVTLATATENALVAGGNATTDLSGGVPFDYQLPAPTIITPKLAIGRDGVAIGLVDSTGKIISTFSGISAPGAPTGLALTAIAGGVLATFAAPASNGGTPIIGYEVTLSTGQVQLGETTTITVNAPAGVPVTATAKAINGYDKSAASAVSNSVTPTGAVTPVAPVKLSDAAITGTPTQGVPLTITAATFSGAPTPTVSRVIRMDGTQVASGNASTTYTPVAGEVGKIPSVTDTATNASGTAFSTVAGGAVVAAQNNAYDIVIYGAGMPGVEAAIKAKETNPAMRVLLIDYRDTIGGHTTGAIQFTDAHSDNTGLFTLPEATAYRKLFTTLAGIYGINLNNYFQQRSFSSESKTTLAQVNAMLSAVGITPVMGNELLSITKNGLSIASATFSGIGTVTAKQWIECSYTGDLLMKSGADYILGGEASTTYGEQALQAGFVTAGGQPAAFVDPYVTTGNSASGLLKYVLPGALQAAGSAVVNKVQYPGYRLSMTNTAGKKVTIPDPADATGDYNTWPRKADYELHRRDALANKQSATTIASFLNLQGSFPAIPSTTSGMTNKRDANNGGIFSLDFPDTVLATEYFTNGTTKARRKEIEDIAWQYTLGYLYFLRNDPAVPAAARADIANYGWPNDDYLATNGRPPAFYLRETVRAIGDTPCSALMITGALNTLVDPVALAMYAFDKHPRGFYVSTSGGDHVIQEGQTPSNVVQSTLGARIARRVTWPKASQVDNLLLGGTTPNGSQMFYNSERIEGTMACIAGFCAINAVKAIETSTPVQQVPYATIAPIHNLYGLDAPNSITVTSDIVSGAGTRTQGTWTERGSWADSGAGILGTRTLRTTTATTGDNGFDVAPTIGVAGNYKVQFKYLDSGSITRGKLNLVVTANGVAGTTVLIDQNSKLSTVLTNGDWQDLGTYAFTANDAANNKISATSLNDGNAANAGAIRLIKV